MRRLPVRVVSVALTGALVASLLAGGASPAGGQTTPTVTAPGAPTGVQASIVDGVATVRWSAPASSGGTPVLRYTITPSRGCPVVVDGSASSATLTGLPASGDVTFSVTTGTAAGFSAAGTSSATTSSPKGDGYRLVAADGGVFNYGSGRFFGSAAGTAVATVVDAVETPTGNGYFLVSGNGAVYAYGDARYLGGANGSNLNAPITGISRNAAGTGYVLVGTDGGVFAYGANRFAGSAASLRLNAPISSIASTPSGNGYWMVAVDGGVFAYGDARFYGSAANDLVRGQNVVDIEPTQTGDGYWLVTSGGAVYAYGDARFYGGANGLTLAAPIVGMTASPTDRGYLLAAADGGSFNYGDSRFAGSAAGVSAERAIAIVATKPVADPVTLQFLQLSDFHGQIEPNGANGGAGVLSTLWQRDRANYPATFTVNSGDNFGASPAISAFFDELPTVDSMNVMGYDVNGFGNHEFDKSLTLLRTQIARSNAPWVLANHTNTSTELPGVRPYVIVEKGGVKVAFIGVNTPETSQLVSPGNLGTMQITDPTAAVTRSSAEARAAGADVVVVLAHLGINQSNFGSGGTFTANPTGGLADIARNATGVDLYYGGHTHQDYAGIVNGVVTLQTTNASNRYTRTRMCVDPTTKDIIGTAGEQVTPAIAGVTPDPAAQAIINAVRPQLVAQLDPVVGTASAVFDRGTTVAVPGGTPAVERAGEVAVGNLVADAMRTTYGTQLALMNGGGLRTQLPAATYIPGNTALRRNNQPGFPQGPPFDIVRGDVFALLPFGNLVVTKTITGETLWRALENGVSRWPASDGRFPQISGFRFSFDATLPAGSRITSVELEAGGGTFTPIPRDGTAYTVATNDFMNQGGDGYTMLNDGTGVSQGSLAQVTADFITAAGTITPTTTGRITRIAPL
jgi:5'-nucleotidase